MPPPACFICEDWVHGRMAVVSIQGAHVTLCPIDLGRWLRLSVRPCTTLHPAGQTLHNPAGLTPFQPLEARFGHVGTS